MQGLLEDRAERLGSRVGERHGRAEARARAQLREQIGRLESELAALFASAFGHTEVPHRVAAASGSPRLLDLGELERVRDALAARTSEARAAIAEREQVEARNRELLAQMLADPGAHKGLRVSRADVGEPGCGAWHSLPRLGPLGRLMGWWRVKVSSGCPLVGRLAAVERQELEAQAPAG